MNYQQWTKLSERRPDVFSQNGHAESEPLAINTGGYIFRGRFIRNHNGDCRIVDSLGKAYSLEQIENWSWSSTEPEPEMLMVKAHGIYVAHWWNEIGHLLRIIDTLNVRFFVEIGLLDGGLTAHLLSMAQYTGLGYLGVNLGLHYLNPKVQKIAECLDASFLDRDAWQTETVAEVSRMTLPGLKTMIYCDGGDKAKEAHLYWPILRPGDLLGMHDYSDDPESKGPEVYPKDIADLLEQGKRIGREELKDTRILLLEKPA